MVSLCELYLYLDLIQNRDSFLYSHLQQKYDLAIEALIAKQDSRGCWCPFWDWSEVDAIQWKKAKKEWEGVLTRIVINSISQRQIIA